jgi:hypothetical protein
MGIGFVGRETVEEGLALSPSSDISPLRYLGGTQVHNLPAHANNDPFCGSRSCRKTQHSPLIPEQTAMVPASALMVKAPLEGGGWNNGLVRETAVLMGISGDCNSVSISLLVFREYTCTTVR